MYSSTRRKERNNMNSVTKKFLYPFNGDLKASLTITVNRKNRMHPFRVQFSETCPNLFKKPVNNFKTRSADDVRCFLQECAKHLGEYILSEQNAKVNINYPPKPTRRDKISPGVLADIFKELERHKSRKVQPTNQNARITTW